MLDYQVKELMKLQGEFYKTGKTLSVAFRKKMLKRLKVALEVYRKDIEKALKEDLGKSAFESYMTEIGMILEEISWMMKRLGKLSKNKRVRTPLSQFPSKSFISPKPYGRVLIISPWNYPLLLCLGPLVDAIAAGNVAIIKPSELAPATANVISKIIKECYNEAYVSVVNGGQKENKILLAQKFDKIFFTGSKNVGREVLKAAAKNLTPVTLELGGKSPCIVDKKADIKLAAKRIVFGKFLNCGQTCVAPDYILCHSKIKDKLVDEIVKEIVSQYGSKPLENEAYGKIINERHFNRLVSLIDEDKILWGGKIQENEFRIEPTVMTNVTWDDQVMKDEIFGPILPVLSFDNLKEAIEIVQSNPHPLALYIFSNSRKNQKKILKGCQFGGGCINDVVIHLATTNMPFGGVGESGMGSYHGKAGFDEFTHYRSIVHKKNWLDLPIRYQPYNKFKFSLLKKFLR